MTTDQATQKRYVCTIIETMWKRYNNQLRSEDHELVILAVPTYPANIEAVSALDLSDVNDLMAVFAKHREDHPDELHPIEPSPDDAQDEAGDGVDARDRGQAEVPAEQQMGTRHDGGGTPQVGAEPAPEQDEGDAAGDAMERPIFELIGNRKDCRQGPAEPFAKITPHLYSPDFQAMGDCRVCGHGPDKPWHT